MLSVCLVSPSILSSFSPMTTCFLSVYSPSILSFLCPSYYFLSVCLISLSFDTSFCPCDSISFCPSCQSLFSLIHLYVVYLWAFCLSSPSLLSLVLLFLRFSLSPLLSHIDCCDRTTESSCEGTKHNITFLTFYWWYSIAGVDSRQELQYACRQTIGSHGPIKGRQQARTTGYL